jgi:hypothetical protein
MTGIELGTDACVLVDVRRTGDRLRLASFRFLQWRPADAAPGAADASLTAPDLLRRARTALRLPRRARVVAWNLSGQPGEVVDASAEIAPLVEAGFHVEAVVTPGRALATLAAARPPVAGAAAWLALNRDRGAIAIVAGGRLLFEREFSWAFDQRFRAHDRLFHRYLLVAHLASELRHGMNQVSERDGTPVATIVTCGNMPDLRSLTMPLIEELDMDVETLDSTDGLMVPDPAQLASMGDSVAGLWLASAVVDLDPSRRRRASPFAMGRAAVLAGLAGALGWWAYTAWDAPPSRPSADVAPVPAIPADSGRPATPPPPQAASQASQPPLTRPERAPASRPATDPGATGTMGTAEGGARQTDPRPAARQPLAAPLPIVSSTLVSADRRLAIVNGVIVREGDAVGPRTVVAIETAGVVLREPSGHQVRVPIRPRSRRNR